jgi:hypothetical protein
MIECLEDCVKAISKPGTDYVLSLFMYVYFAEEEADAEIHGRRNSIGGPDRTFRRARRAIYVLIAATSFAMLIFLVSATILHWFGRVGETWANILGVAVAVFACVQWIPQVMTSWKLGHLGSLSLTSLCLSAPVGFTRMTTFEY